MLNPATQLLADKARLDMPLHALTPALGNGAAFHESSTRLCIRLELVVHMPPVQEQIDVAVHMLVAVLLLSAHEVRHPLVLAACTVDPGVLLRPDGAGRETAEYGAGSVVEEGFTSARLSTLPAAPTAVSAFIFSRTASMP